MQLKTYPKYKNSDIQWIGKIPEGWGVERYKLRFKYIKGKIPKNLEEKNEKGYLPYLNMEYLRGNEEGILYAHDSKSIKVNEEDLLLLWDGSNAGEFVLGKKGYLSSTMVKLNVKKINLDFSWYLCKSFEPILRDLTIGMGIPHVNGDVLGNIRIPIPINEEQIVFVIYLDKKISKIDALIEKDKKLITLLKEKRIALINHTVTKGLDPNVKMKDSGIEWIGEIPEDWEVKKLKHTVLKKITDGPHETPEFMDEGIPFISAEAIKKDKIDFSLKRGFILEELHKIYCRKCKPKLNDVFMVKSGATTGNIAIVETEKEFSIWSPLALIRANKAVLSPRLLYYILLSDYFKKNVEISWSFGTQQNIGMGVIENMNIIVPQKYEQSTIINYLDEQTTKINSTIQKVERKIKLLEEYKKSLIHHVVTGKIDVRRAI
jgi:type I restriction enzyme S subunit